MSVLLALKKVDKDIAALENDVQLGGDTSQFEEELRLAKDKKKSLLATKARLEGSNGSAPTPAPSPPPAIAPANPPSTPKTMTPRPTAAPASMQSPAPKPAPPPPKPAPQPPKPVVVSQPAAQQAASKSNEPTKETPEELQARIEELQRQIREAEMNKKKKTAAAKQGTTSTPGAATKTNSPPRSSPPARNSATSSPVRADVSSTKPKSKWDRPDWANEMDKQDNRDVISDPINTNLKEQKEHEGYRRQVKAQDLEIQKGTFVKKQDKKPDPRLTWIVGRIGERGVPGKIVMHLYGKHVASLVDDFVHLKNMTVAVGGPNGASLTVDCEPELFIYIGRPTGLDDRDGVYGVVQEGHEIVQKLVDAGSAGSDLSIKQAHIFPVKKSKSSF